MPPVAPSGVLVGRNSELAMLAGLVKGLAARRGGSVLVEGEPGIGKTALVQAALASVSKGGFQVFWGAGDELGQALPLLPFLDALRVREPSGDPRRITIVRLLRGEIATLHAADGAAVLAEQLQALIAEQCTREPAVLVIDDLQWADPASIRLWGRLASSARQMPLLLVGMMRPVPRRDDLHALRRALSHGARLELAGLAGEAVAGLVAVLAGGEPDSELMRLADDAGGNPLYITELIAALTRSARVTITGTGAAAVTAGSTPGSLSAAIADRLGFVTDPEREVLRGAALLGVDFAVADLAIVLGRGVADLVGFLDEARAAGVLAASGKRFRFRHPLIRAALYEEMPEPVRAAWHREAGRALAEAGAPVDRVARQLLLAVGGPDGTPEPAAAAEPMDEWMLSWLAGTAGPLVSQAPQVAAQLLRQAVAGSRPGPQHGHLAAGLADALYRVGDITEAERVARQALAHAAEPDLLADLHWTLVQCVMREGRFAESLATLDQALASPGLSARHRARLLVLAARTHSNFGRAEEAARAAASALEAASEADDSWAMGWALHMMALVTSMSGRLTEALPLYDRALTATQADPALADLRLLVQVNLAITLGSLDRYEEALTAARQARDFADQVGATLRLGQARGALGQLLYQMGRWDDALAEMESMPEDLKEDGAVCTELGIAAVISFHRGDVPGARRHLATAAPYAARLKPRLVASLALARSLDYEYAGALPEALAALAAGDDSPEDIEETEEVLGNVVRLAIAAGDLAGARAFAGQAATIAAGSEVPHRQAAALYCRGLLDGDAPLLLAAAERYEDASRPLMRAKALEAAAEHFLRADDRSQARAAFTGAVDGLRLPRRGRRRRPA